MNTVNVQLGDNKTNLLGMGRAELQEFFATLGEKPFRADQLLKWIHQQGVSDFEAMTNISKPMRTRLQECAEVRGFEIITDQLSDDGSRKWLFRLRDGNAIESVYIPEENRGTLCISSQVGCALNCTFCATGAQGFNRNLDTAEIIGQLWEANRLLGAGPGRERIISNVVLMGMGEPLLNMNNVVRAMHLMRHDLAYGLSKRRITLSTSGVVPALDILKEVCDVSLAVSLHAPNDVLRNELVPLNKKYPIKELMAACRRYVAGDARRKVTFEYVLLDGINDKEEHARQLVSLLKDMPAKVNLIPFNPFMGTQYTRSRTQNIDRFWRILMAAGLTTITRKTRGDDIDAACGQLAGDFHDRTRRRSGQRPTAQKDEVA